MTKYRVTAARLNVRMGAGIDKQIIGQLAQGAIIEPTGSVDWTNGDSWHALRVTGIGGAECITPEVAPRVFCAHRYGGEAFTEVVDAPPVVPPTPEPTPVPTPVPKPVDTFPRQNVGVHVITNHGAAQSAYDAGARVVMFMENKLECVQFKQAHPDATVVYRAYVGNAWLSPEDMVRKLSPNQNDPPVTFVGLNESDSANNDPDAIRKRAAWDVEVAQRIKAIQPNAHYLAGSFAHGNPDLTNDDVCKAIREAYAPHYNAGLFGFDIHNYTLGWIREVDPIWLERRWEMLFTKCGFDPRVRDIWATETGVEAGHGGFAWGIEAGRIPADALTQWLAYNDMVQRAPLIVDGVAYPSPFRGATLFTHKGNWWLGYWIPIEQAVGYWRGDRLQMPTWRGLAEIGGGTLPEGYHPPRKVMPL